MSGLALVATLLVLTGATWWLWNLHGQVGRLDDLLHRCRDSLRQLLPEDDAEAPSPSVVEEPQPPIRVIIQITDAIRLAKRHSAVGGLAGAIAPNVLKKAMHAEVLKQTNKALLEGGYDAEVRVIVL